jgi:hypothetical protein
MSDKPHSRQNTGTYNMKQPVVTESSDEGGQIVYRCATEIYNVHTGRTELTCEASARDEIEARLSAADQGLAFIKNAPEDA